MNIQTKPLSEVTQQALALLTKELGIVDTVRFLNQFTTGYGDYTAERDALFADVTLDEILTTIKSKPGPEVPNPYEDPVVKRQTLPKSGFFPFFPLCFRPSVIRLWPRVLSSLPSAGAQT